LKTENNTQSQILSFVTERSLSSP